MDKQDELFVVVDKNDKIVGYRTRYDCHHDKNLIHRSIGIIIFNNKGQVLLQKRSKNKDLDPGMYTLSASGHVDKGETYLQAAKRELLEELGIKILIRRKGKFLLKMPQETEMTYLFTANYEGPFDINKEEVDEVRFVNMDELPKMLSQLTPFTILSLKQISLL